MSDRFIIVGAGIAGLCMAISLQKRGYDVIVYESDKNISGVGAGLGLASNAIKALEYLNLADEIIPLGTMLESLTIRDPKGKPILTADTTLVKNSLSDNFSIHRQALHQFLLQKIKPNTLVSNKKVLDIYQNADKVQITFSDETTDEADYLIASDGVGSIVRQRLIPNSKPIFAGYTCWRAVIKNPGIDLKNGNEIWGTHGRFGFTPLQGNLVYWYICLNTNNNYEKVTNYNISDFQNIFKDYCDPIPLLLQNTPQDIIINNNIVDIKPLRQFAFDRILLIGDAAHATTPNMGQGACMAY